MTARLISLTIEAFRGFADVQTVPLDGDVVLLTGGNGVGKTSVVDAITWVLCGSLPHLDRARRRRNEEVVVSRYRPSAASSVTLVLSIGGSLTTATRVGTSLENSLQLQLDGTRVSGSRASLELAKVLGADSHEELVSAVERWGILRQDEVRAVLNVNPDEVHSRLRDLLGLRELDDFDAALKAAKDRREAALGQSEDAVARAKRSAESAREAIAHVELESQNASGLQMLEFGLQDAIDRHRELVTVRELRDETSKSYRSLLGTLRSVWEELRGHDLALTEVDQRLASLPADTQTQALEHRRADIAREVIELASAVEDANMELSSLHQRADAHSRLAGAAIPLLGPFCPVCEQGIDENQVLNRLESTTGGLAQELAAALTRLGETQRALAERQTESRTVEADVKNLRSASAEKRRLGAQREGIVAALGALATQETAVRAHVHSLDSAGIQQVLRALGEIGQALRAVVTSLDETPAPNRARAEAQLQEAEDKITAMSPDLERLRTSHRTLDELYRAVQEEAVVVTGRELEALNPLFSEVYRRLAPHPTFTDLELQHDLYRRRGRTMPVLMDPLLEVEANPQVICSVGQLNVVALSYFLAMSVMAGERALPFMVMDDPLQSLDEVNVLGFADLCRRLRLSRQLVITTHDRRFSELLTRKLTPRDGSSPAIQLEFSGWARNGPRIERRYLTAEPAPQLLPAG